MSNSNSVNFKIRFMVLYIHGFWTWISSAFAIFSAYWSMIQRQFYWDNLTAILKGGFCDGAPAHKDPGMEHRLTKILPWSAGSHGSCNLAQNHKDPAMKSRLTRILPSSAGSQAEPSNPNFSFQIKILLLIWSFLSKDKFNAIQWLLLSWLYFFYLLLWIILKQNIVCSPRLK